MNIDNFNDFGFATFADEPIEEQKTKLDQMYKLIEPLIQALLKDAETNPNIHWPGRKEVLTKLLKELDSIVKE